MDVANQIRCYSLLSATLTNREEDPFCRSCSSFLSTLLSAKDGFSKFGHEHADEIEKLPNGLSLIFLVARSRIAGIRIPDHPLSQKKTGRCNLPENICFAKSSLTLLHKIQGENELRHLS